MRLFETIDMKCIGSIIVIVSCLLPAVVWSADEAYPLSLGVGGGLDISAYAGEGVFDLGPAVGAFLAYTSRYPLVFRLDGRWSRVYGDYEKAHGADGCPDGGWKETRSHTDFASVRLSAVCFEEGSGWAVRYGGLGVGAMMASPSEDEASWGFLLSPLFGVSLRAETWTLSIESGGDLTLGSHASFAVIPVRVLFEL